MGNKQSYNLNVVFAKLKCITDFSSNNTGNGGNSRTNRWILILTAGICGAMRSTVALWDDSSAVFVREQMEIGV